MEVEYLRSNPKATAKAFSLLMDSLQSCSASLCERAWVDRVKLRDNEHFITLAFKSLSYKGKQNPAKKANDL